MGTSRRRRTPVRAALVLLTGALTLLLAGCRVGDDGAAVTSTVTVQAADSAVAQFAAAWQSGRADAVGALTSAPAAATQQIGVVLKSLTPTRIAVTTSPVVSPRDGAATTTATFVWTLPEGITFKYDAPWVFARGAAGWTATWSPTLIHPKLQAEQSLAVEKSASTGGSLVDRNNVPLVGPVTVYSVVALGAKITDLPGTAKKLETLLKPYDATVTAASIVAGVKTAGAAGYTVTNLRESDYQSVSTPLAGIPGLTFPSQVRQLPPTKDLAKTLLAQATPVAAKLVTGSSGWQIAVVDATGAELETVAEKVADPGSNVTLTLDTKMQQSAETVLAGVSEPAVIVAIQPSTGEILTVAQNAAANTQGPIALRGEYPPGSTFKIVTATAAFDHHLADPTTQVDCPGVFTIDGREIHNEGFELGQVSLTRAFAKSCNTTFAKLATQLPVDGLTQAAFQYGIGRDFDIPGITTLTGKVPTASGVDQLAEDGFGQGVVLVTPFSAALMAATAANGTMPTPTLIRGQKTTIDQLPPARSAATRDGIRVLMRDVVTEGTATVLGGDGEVYAKTGTADYVDAQGQDKAHAWTVGYRGDVAFAALIVGGDSSKRTNALLDAWLKTFPAS